MPDVDKILGKPVDESKWTRAKGRAAEEGRGGDYAYIMSIYKRMAHLGKSVTVKRRLKKSNVDRPSEPKYNTNMRLVIAGERQLDEFRCGSCKSLLFKGIHLEKSVIEVKCRSCGTMNVN